MKLFLIVFATICTSFIYAQEIKLSGVVKDDGTNKSISSATIIIRTDEIIGAKTNLEGEFDLTLTPGKYSVIVRALDYSTFEDTISFLNDSTITFQLTAVKIESIDAVVVTSVKENENITKAGMNVTTLTPEDI